MRNFLIALAALLFFQQCIANVSVIVSGSMEDTLLVGDVVLVNRVAYGLRLKRAKPPVAFRKPVKQGDIILAVSPAEKADLMKRCVAVGGQTVELRDKTLFIDGIAENPAPGVKHADPDTISYKDLGKKRDTMPPKTVPPDSMFLMGDNRDFSLDSRLLGPRPENEVIGKAVMILWSLDPKVSWSRPWEKFRSGRWFKKIN